MQELTRHPCFSTSFGEQESADRAERKQQQLAEQYKMVHSRTAGLSFRNLFWGFFLAVGAGAGSTEPHFRGNAELLGPQCIPESF